jgi:hypothetical protein
MANNVPELTGQRPLVNESGVASKEMWLWSRAVTDRLVIVGTGSPESVFDANIGAMYIDDAGTSGNILYVKRDASVGGDKSQGWILV